MTLEERLKRGEELLAKGRRLLAEGNKLLGKEASMKRPPEGTRIFEGTDK